MAGHFRTAFTSGDGATASTTTLRVPEGADTWTSKGVVAGDYLLIAVASNFNGNTVTTPAGWTLVSGPDDNGSGLRVYHYGKILTSGDITTGFVNLVWSAASRTVAVAVAVQDPDPTTPIQAVMVGSNNATAAPTTTADAGDVAVLVAASGASSGTPPTTSFAGLGSDAAAMTAFGSGANRRLIAAHIDVATTGAVGGQGLTNAYPTSSLDLVFLLAVNGLAVNSPPTVPPISNQTVAAATGCGISIAATDDGSIASYATSVTRYRPDAAPAAVTVTGAGTTTPTWTSGPAGSLDVATVVVTDNDSATTTITTEIRVPTTGEILPLRGFPGVGTAPTNTGGAASLGEALGDNSDSTYGEWPAATGSEQPYRVRLTPASTRSALTSTHQLAQDTAGTLTAKVRLYQATTTTGATVTLVKEWTYSTLTTSFADYTGAVDSGSLATIADWGNLWVAIVEV